MAQGLNIIRAAERSTTLEHLLLQSMHRAGRSPHDPTIQAPLHHRAKWQIEEALKESQLSSWSILRQPTYLENFGNDEAAAKGTQLRCIRPGVVSGLLAADEQLTVIAVEDLGKLAVRMLAQAEHGHVLAAGAERISGRHLAEVATRISVRDASFEYRQVPWWVLRFFIPVDYPQQLQAWLSKGGNDEGAGCEGQANLAATRDMLPEIQSVDEWLRERGVDQIEPANATPQLSRRTAVASMLPVTLFASRSIANFADISPSASLHAMLIADTSVDAEGY